MDTESILIVARLGGGGGCRGMVEKVRGLRSKNRQLHNSHEEVKYSIRNGVAKEFICTIHGHEQ